MEEKKALCGTINIETIGASTAVARWREARAGTPGTGLYPIIVGQPLDVLGQPEDLEFIEVGADAPWSLAEVLAKATPEALAAFRQERQADAAEAASEIGEYPERGDWPDEPGTMDDPEGLAVLLDLDDNPVDEVLLAHVRAASGADALGALGYGAWNDCPHPWIHVAQVRAWQERYGAELVVGANDTLEFFVSRPPRTREAAIELALEQFWYCADIVDQGVGTIEALANELLDAPRWFFWWD